MFKERGVDGAGIAGLVSEAGLTNGAFYAHFDSKDDLVAHVIGEQMAGQAEALSALPSGRAGLRLFIADYLTTVPRDHPSIGCPSAALPDEIAKRLDLPELAVARARAIGLYTLMVGTLQLSRAVTDDRLSGEVLRSGIENAEVFLR